MATETHIPDVKERFDPPYSESPVTHRAKHDSEISLLDLLIIFAERKQIILRVTAGSAILAIVISLLLPKRYTAAVTLIPPQQNSSIGAALASQSASLGAMAVLAGGGLGLKNPNDMFVAMLKSRTVEDAMVQRFELMREYRVKYPTDARKAFEQRATVDGSGKDGLIHISVKDADPSRAAELANGYVDQFRNLTRHLAITEASQRRLFFEQELEQVKDKLADAEEALKQTQQTTGMLQLDSQARALIASAASLRAEIAAKEVEIEGMRAYATGENAQLVQAQRELEGMQAQLSKLGGSGDLSSGELLLPKGRVPEAGLEYARKLRDVKYYEAVFEILARQFELAKLDEAKQGALVQVVDAAIPPDKRSFPKRGLIVICATFAGFFLGLFIALAQAGYARLKADPQASGKLFSLRSLLTIRRLKRSEVLQERNPQHGE